VEAVKAVKVMKTVKETGDNFGAIFIEVTGVTAFTLPL